MVNWKALVMQLFKQIHMLSTDSSNIANMVIKMQALMQNYTKKLH